jgi:hypothetical protein
MSKPLVEVVPGLGRQVIVFVGDRRVPLLSRTGQPALFPFGEQYDRVLSQVVGALDRFDEMRVVS